MSPRIKYGLIVGVVGSTINLCVVFTLSICSPFLGLLVGGVAGFLTVQEERPPTQGAGAQAGAIAGAIAGIGFFLILLLFGLAFGGLMLMPVIAPSTTGPAASTSDALMASLALLSMNVCLGLGSLVATALGGAVAGFLGTPSSPTPAAPTYPSNF